MKSAAMKDAVAKGTAVQQVAIKDTATGDDQPQAFDACGPLPVGITVLEASAGTGKTHAIGDLVTRYVAEGVATLDELLVVTFGRAASQELRERVRGHLVAAERALADPDAAAAAGNPVHRLLVDAPAPEVRLRRERLRAALAGFDAATIVTTHQFCQYVLTGLGIAGDGDADVELVESLDDLIVEVVDDLYVRAFAGRVQGEPIFDRATALSLARTVINDPQARLEPVAEAAGSPAARRVGFGGAVRREVDRRKRHRRVLGYDDLLSRLAAALEPADAPARARMRARWSIVLVDEFQDTDPVQWQILERAFGDATVVLVGDPKQSIYAFRGGDIDTYLSAAQTAGAHPTLTRNWRTDAPLVDALQVLLGGVALGSPEIPVRPVTATTTTTRLVGAPSGAPLRLRVLRRSDFAVSRNGKIPIDRAREFVARDLTADVAELLGSGATFNGNTVQARDIAVIVEHPHAGRRWSVTTSPPPGIPAVLTGNASVFQTKAGDDWQVLLEALEQPHRAGRVRAAALTPFLGITAAELAAGGDRLTDDLSVLCSRWAAVFTARGVAALLEVAAIEQELPARMLGRVDGERQLTDLRHVGQALHAAAMHEGLGLPALTDWLRRRRADIKGEVTIGPGAPPRHRRGRRAGGHPACQQGAAVPGGLPAVQLRPSRLRPRHPAAARPRSAGAGHRRRRDDRPGTTETQALAEDAGEALRHLYVGLTRAQSQVVTWWAPTHNTPCSGLHRVLFGRRDMAGGVPDRVELVNDDLSDRKLRDWQQRGAMVIEQAAITATPAPPPPADTQTCFEVGTFDRPVDGGWRRMSYSSMSAAGSSGIGGDQRGGGSGPAGSIGGTGTDGLGAAVGSEPESREREDETIPAVRAPAGSDADLRSVISPMFDLPAGTTFGTLVHAVLETTDPQAADLPAELLLRCREQLARRGGLVTAAQLAQGLLPVLHSPLGPLAPGYSLADIAVRDRLAEMDFEIPLSGGDAAVPVGEAAAGITLGDLAPVLRRHLSADDPLVGYADRLASPAYSWQPLAGYLTGSLDVVVRLPGPRYLVADYKTNWLGDASGEPLSAWHYRPAALDAVMAGSDYPLQALLYCVALHRFLRWRQPDYDPAVHIGGVLYLFVRGMCGPETPLVDGKPCGVFGWQPPAALVSALSDLLDGDDAGSASRPAAAGRTAPGKKGLG